MELREAEWRRSGHRAQKRKHHQRRKKPQLLELSRVEGELVANDCSIGDSTSSWFEVQYQNKTRYVERSFEVEMNASGGVITA